MLHGVLIVSGPFLVLEAPLPGPCGRGWPPSSRRSTSSTSEIASWDTFPPTRKALTKALRSSAVAMHRWSRCTQAPRPSARRRGSGERAATAGSWTIRSNRESESRPRQPTQVRIGPRTSVVSGRRFCGPRIRPPRFLAAPPARAGGREVTLTTDQPTGRSLSTLTARPAAWGDASRAGLQTRSGPDLIRRRCGCRSATG